MILINKLNGNVTIRENTILAGNISFGRKLSLMGNLVNGGTRSLPRYEGETIITPSGEAQILATKDTRVLQNITIEPIPSNYGLITWNGSYLTVS